MSTEKKRINVGTFLGCGKAPTLFETMQKAQRDILESGIEPNADGFYDPDELAKVLDIDPKVANQVMKEVEEELIRVIDELLNQPNPTRPSREADQSKKQQSDADRFLQQLAMGSDIKRMFSKANIGVPDNLKETVDKLTQKIDGGSIVQKAHDLLDKVNVSLRDGESGATKDLSKTSIDETFTKRMKDIRSVQSVAYDKGIKDVALSLVSEVENQVRHEKRPFEEINNINLKYIGRVDLSKFKALHGTNLSMFLQDVIKELETEYGFKLPNVEIDLTNGKFIKFTYTPVYINHLTF